MRKSVASFAAIAVTRARASRLGDVAAYGTGAFALAIAGVAYVALRGGLRLHGWVNAIVGAHAIDRLRAIAHDAALPAWVRFTLPDALWQLALSVIVFRIWRGARWTPAKIAWCALASSFGVVIELAQRARWIEGTYDFADVVGSLAAVGVAGVISVALPASPADTRTL